jgi:hypothetical protein
LRALIGARIAETLSLNLFAEQLHEWHYKSQGHYFGWWNRLAPAPSHACHVQTILTIKSDDVPGRSKAYEAIIKGEKITRVNLPESFNVLVRELKGLALDVSLLKKVGPNEFRPAEDVRAEREQEMAAQNDGQQ